MSSHASHRTRLRVECLENRLTPATFKVTTIVDVRDAADGFLSLREAVDLANAAPNLDTIKLRADTYTSAIGDFDLFQPVTIKGKGAERTIVDGNQLDRVFECHGAFIATFIGLRLQNGSSAAGGGIYALETDVVVKKCFISSNTAQTGGGIQVDNGSVTLFKTIVSGNHATSSNGGGINAPGSTVTITNSTIGGNLAGANGGGIRASTVIGTNSTVTDNTAQGNGGGGISAPTVTLTNCTISFNFANVSSNGSGGGINALDLIMSGCTVRENVANDVGGGIVAKRANISSSTITRNSVTGAGSSDGDGGGIWIVDGNLTLSSSTVSLNEAGRFGGGIWTDSAALDISTSTIAANVAANLGGGVFSRSTDVAVTRSTISGNSAGESGGGIDVGSGSSLTMADSTVSANVAASGVGGGIVVGADISATLFNTTISGNTAADGGGIFAASNTIGTVATITLTNVTITKNTANQGGGIFKQSSSFSGTETTLRIANSIVAGNSADTSPDIHGSATSDGHNLVGNRAGTSGFNADFGDLFDDGANPLDPKLGTLDDNGGPTFTHALLRDSPAIDAGDTDVAPAKDQRGFARVKDGNGDGSRIVDIGAFEK